MPIMAVDERNDARGAAWLLASTARDCIDDPAKAVNPQVALNNVYRLLESYRMNPFFGLAPEASSGSGDPLDALSVMQPIEQHIGEVKSALDQAIGEVFAGISEEQAIESVEAALRSIAYPQPDKNLSEEDRKRTVRFFDEFIVHLHF
ncbi:hypothetical protein [Magnetovibrio blakemorei]|uniref:Uncharacterized protein n=1 Tax=Magnetovibrio blakemorei TaxID=28181 RepID=A0A1E5Q3A6_9PROT|nr:hypothetical protein [Magnetovibrio blakemorei]OEJ64082.1 hypothetical protein BEN30_01370 [Magnetovibrio blakemorei]